MMSMLTVYIRVNTERGGRKWVAVPGVYASKSTTYNAKTGGYDDELWQLSIRAKQYKRPWKQNMKVTMGKWYTMIRRKQ